MQARKNDKKAVAGFSVLMPTYNQASYIRRAISSLQSQTYTCWELIIINDGATDETEEYIREYLSDKQIVYLKNTENQGLGFAINQGLDQAKYDHIAYLPSDDYYYDNHLELLKEEFEKPGKTVLTFTAAISEIKDSLTYDVKQTTNGIFNSFSLQLVQTAHKKTPDRWTTRSEWVSENLFGLFWHKLVKKGNFTSIKQETCCWTSHPYQHHKLVCENYGGGLNIYRQYYNIQTPIKIKVSKYKYIDEEALYKNFRSIKPACTREKSLKILIVGELAYNAERIHALEERGHRLYGLWMNKPTFSFSTVGHLPFGNVVDIPYEKWEEKVKEIQPDIIYATLNFGAVPLAHEVLLKKRDIPFVWHFKEGPFLCRQHGTWSKLMDLYHKADGKIYLNPEIKTWYEQFIPTTGQYFILDGDLPKLNYFTNDFSELISVSDEEIHTVIPGRIIGVSLADFKILTKKGIHIHLYTENYHASKDSYQKEMLKVLSGYFHIHSHCSPDSWVKEFSKYDAGWLHCFDSRNKGFIRNAGWDDLNLPARMNTLAAAGLPMIQKRNAGHIVAMKSHLEKNGLGIFFDSFEELADQLLNKKIMENARKNVLAHRDSFSFDYHVDDLVEFFRKVIKQKITG